MSDNILYPPLTYNTPILCEYDKVISQFNSLITNVNTAMPCKVVAIEKQEQRGVNIVGFVDIQLMIEQTNGQKKGNETAIICNVPYIRIQGGTNAVIIDPEINDLGVAIFASRDITNFKEARRQTPPATWRKFSISDAIYIGGIRNQKPVQYIHFRNDGIEVYSPKRVHITTPTVLIDSDNTTINTSENTTINANNTTINTSAKTTINANSSCEITTPTVLINSDNTTINTSAKTTINANGGCEINAETTNNGNVQINGNTKISGNLLVGGIIGQTGEAGGGGNVSLIGPVNVINDLHAEGISVAHHTHTCPDGGTSEPH